MTTLRSLVYLSILLGLNACGVLYKNTDSIFKDHTEDYYKTANTPIIDVPEGLNTPQFTPLYPVQTAVGMDEFGDPILLEEYSVPRPPAIGGDAESFVVKIQKLDQQQWIALNVSPSQVWPRVQNFLNQLQLPVASSSPREGVIETDWLQFNNDQENKVRFKLRLEKGVHPDTTEVYITQMQQPMEADTSSLSGWPQTSDDAEKETWFMGQLAENLASSINDAAASLLGQYIGGDLKASFVRETPEPTLFLRLSEQRAWAMLTESATKGGFISWQTDANLGLIFAGFDPFIVEDKGFWKRVFSVARKRVPEKSRYTLEKVLQHLSSEAVNRDEWAHLADNIASGFELKGLQEGYLILVQSVDGGFYISLSDERGRSLERTEAKELLRVLRKNLP